MSTKIHHGYRLRQGYSIFDFRTKFAAVMQKEVKLHKMNKLTSATILFMDKIDCKDKTATKSFREFLKKNLAYKITLTPKEQKETSNLVKNSFNYVYYTERVNDFKQDPKDALTPNEMCSVTIVHNSVRNENYILFYGSVLLEKVFETFPEIEGFPYWNNADAPDDMTEDEWNDRGKAWDEAVDLDSSMSSQGFVVDPFDAYQSSVGWKEYEEYLPHANEKFFPTKEDRLDFIVRDILIYEYATQIKKDGTPLMLSDMSDYIRDSANIKRIEEQVGPKLRDITAKEYAGYLSKD